MAQVIPERWRHRLAQLRTDIHDTLDRWWHHHRDTTDHDSNLAVRQVTPEIIDDNGWPLQRTSFFNSQLPLIDVEQTDDDVCITAELPGLEKNDFTVDISGDRTLRIRGEKKQSTEKKTGNTYYAECSYGAFSRTVPLPCDINADRAQATYKQGTLRIILPKTDRAKTNRVKVPIHTSE